MIILLLATIVQRSVGLGRGVLFCRWLTPETLGQWEMAYSFLLLFAPLAVLGIPGSYGRYLEHYRQRGLLSTFLRRTSIWTFVCSSIAIGLLIFLAPQFANLVFGSTDSVTTIYAIAACLAAVILHHTLTSLLTALRLFRVVSVMNFAQSLLFAILTLTFLVWYPNVLSIVGGYGLACLAASVGAMVYIWPGCRSSSEPIENLPHADFWGRLLRFAFFVWVTNLLSHLFAVVDRTMILHFGGMSAEVALEQVGHYHSSRIIPLLVVSFADLLSGLIMPHLSHDWELGNHQAVAKKINLAVKLTGLGMQAVGICVLLFAPFMFGTILEGRYSDGLAVLPWTLAGCVISGIYVIAQCYLWCAEHPRLAAVPLAIGLGVNVILNLALVPIWGLYGAVIATTLSTILCLATLHVLNGRYGMAVDRGTWLISMLPISLGFGVIASTGCICIVLLLALTSDWVFLEEERQRLHLLITAGKDKLKSIAPNLAPINLGS
ncbi:lipopolysaccharide biosynthesis protein [Bythopirellula polymerisocia]|uniref:MurJ-like flippase n=1 Tax=Bythopirellula polymerisocia TaxID=2528003 RepID=A0A5C6CSD6_9BACT|nr:oligosaccharide flippase family protein [Bythopirellula polymerisocia]TWU27298.1 MurJ-like flippase [Bythopirellula polymerisocia]